MLIEKLTQFFSKCAEAISPKKKPEPETEKVIDFTKNFEGIVYRYQDLLGEENIWLEDRNVYVQPTAFSKQERSSLQECAARVGYSYTETCPFVSG